jgi:uncharacterized protein YvpB
MEKPRLPTLLDKRIILATALLVILVAVVIGFSIFKEPSAGLTLRSPGLAVATTLSSEEALVSLIPSSTASPAVILTAKVEPTVTPTPFILPESYYLKIIANRQYFALGCEASAAVDLAGYYDILIYQYNFQHELPLSDNPDLGFVGDAKGPWGQIPPYAYGVHASPVADLLNKYGLDAEGGKGYTLEQLKVKIAAGHPIIVWVIGNMVGGVPTEYTDSEGNKSIVAAYEHVVILTGYDQDSVRYVSNGKFYDAQNEVFLNSWAVLGNMAVFHR